jgi:hypothetical protein
MSGYPGMSEWEEFYEAHRRNIEKFLGPAAQRSDRARKMDNMELSKELYKMILKREIDDVILCEAAERLAVAKDLTETKLGEN